MIKNDNRAVIRDLVKGQTKANKGRNRLLLTATILVAFILTAVTSIGVNYYHSVQKREIARSGAQYHGSVNGPTKSQIATLKNDDKIQAVGLLSTSGTVLSSEYETSDVKLLWGDTTYWQQQKTPAIIAMEGAYPTKKNELLLSKKAITKLGLPDDLIGTEIPLKIAQYSGVEEVLSFKITGIYQDYTNKAEAFVSAPYYQEFGMPTEDLGSTRALITLTTPFYFEKDLESLENKLQLRNRQWISVDTERAAILLRSLLALLLIGLVIIICSFLVIHNVLYISIRNDIHYYGLLKTIGTTEKQIKSLINRQVIRLSTVGILIGLLLGAMVSVSLVPRVIEFMSYQAYEMTSTNLPLIFVLAAGFTFATVYFSSFTAANEAAKISPVEATRYTGVTFRKKFLNKKDGSKPYLMAWRNVFRSRKQALLVLLSLFLGVTAFSTVSSYNQNNDGKRILTALNVNDMTLTNKTTTELPGEQVFTDELLNDLTAIEGVKAIHPVSATTLTIDPQKNLALQSYVDEALDVFWAVTPEAGQELMAESPENFLGVLKGIDEASFKKAKAAGKLKIAAEDFLSGKAAIANSLYMLEEKFEGVHQLNYELAQDEQQVTIGEVTSTTVLPSSPLSGFYPTIYVSQQCFDELVGDNPYIDAVTIDYQTSYHQQTEQQLRKLLTDPDLIDVESKLAVYQDMARSESQIKGMGLVLVAILIALAVINFINTITTSIFTRSKEFALLESIGMTTGQQKKMVVMEGVYYWLISSLMVLGLGFPIAFAVFHNTNDYHMNFLFPWKANLVICLLALVLCVACPIAAYTFISRKSIVERIRN